MRTLRAAEGCRTNIVLSERAADIDDMVISCGVGSRVILDGPLVSARAVRLAGHPVEVLVRHCTFVPGWRLEEVCEPCCGEEPSLVLTDIPFFRNGGAETEACTLERPVTPCMHIDRSIVGTIYVERDEVDANQVRLKVSDIVVDATTHIGAAIAAPTDRLTHALVSIANSTVIGQIRTHAIDLGENSLFLGKVEVARRQIGCLRYSYVPPGVTDATPPCLPA